MYESFALLYDRLMHDVKYKQWADYYIALSKLYHIEKGARLLETACGTGSLSQYFAPYFTLLASDISESMLSLADKKLRAQNLSFKLIRLDMKNIGLKSAFDIIICACDGVNYLLDEKALYSFLKSANSALDEGGALIFDISSEYKLKTVLADNSLFEQNADYSYIWHNKLEENIVNLDLEIFHKTQNGLFEKTIESQRQRAWKKDEITQALKQNGFTNIRVFGDKTLSPAKDNDLRWHFCATKV